MTSVYENPLTWRLKTGVAEIPYRIVDMDGDFTDEGGSVSMTMLVPADKLLALAAEMFPPTRFDALGFPIYPAKGRIYGTPFFAQRIRWKGHVDGTPVDPFGVAPTAPEGTYQKVCEVTVDYDTNIDQEESDSNDPETFLTVTCNGAGEYLTSTEPSAEADPVLDAGEEAKAAGEDPTVTIIVPQFEWSANWPRVPGTFYKNLLRPRLRSHVGKVNSTVMPLIGNAPAETVLFVGFSSTANFTWRSATDPFVSLGMRFLEKNLGVDPRGSGEYIGHNHFWQPGVGWAKVKYNGTDYVHQSANLNSIYAP